MRLAYADPPYPGCAHLYKGHADYAGEVDHHALAYKLRNYDGWVLHTSSVAQGYVEDALTASGFEAPDPFGEGGDYRRMAWVKPFAAFKPNVPVAYAWEPVIVKAARKPVVSQRLTLRDWVSEPITMKRGLTGVKPDAVCRWAFEVMGAEPTDVLDDMYPGSGAVSRAWYAWCAQLNLFAGEAS